MEFFILSIMWITYFVIHSGMIAIPVTNFLRSKLGSSHKYYRLFYNFVSLILLFPILKFSSSIPSEMIFIWKGNWIIVKFLLISVSIIIVFLGAQKYSMKQFLGLAQLKTKNNQGLINESGNLDTSGILGFIRHPFYAAVFPIIWARDIDQAALITNIIITIYTILGTYLEEYKLIKEFGDKYIEYKNNVSMYIPLKWVKSRLTNYR